MRDATLIRIGGISIVAALVIHIVLNSVLKEFPPEDLGSADLEAYLAREAGTWAIVHGFRYVAFACIVLFAAGLYSRTSGPGASGWGIVGLLGTGIWVTNGIVTNGIEILAFMDFDLLSARDDLFWLLFRLTRVLFTAEVAAWAITIFGFSVAGWRSATIPRSMSGLGFLAAAGGMISSGFIVSVLDGGRAVVVTEVAALLSLLWFLCVGVLMVLKGDA